MMHYFDINGYSWGEEIYLLLLWGRLFEEIRYIPVYTVVRYRSTVFLICLYAIEVVVDVRTEYKEGNQRRR